MKTVAIIGAGCSGLVAIKTCLDEGLSPMCFESSNDIGGLWRFSDHDGTENRGCVLNTTVINTSKEMTAFSDFPPPKEFANFMHHSKVLEYYRLYAERHQLTQFIQFNSEVQLVKPPAPPLPPRQSSNVHSSDCTGDKAAVLKTECNNNIVHKTGFETANKHPIEESAGIKPHVDGGLTEDPSNRDSPNWIVVVKDKTKGLSSRYRFDAVLICTGHHAQVNMPKIPGEDTFQGQIVHSRDLRHVHKVAGSRQVVVGMGNSACDLAVELSRRAKVFLSTRRGTWLMQRLQARGLPADIAYTNRLVFATAYSLPSAILNRLVAWRLNTVVDHDLYGLRPQHGPIAAHPTVNDELPNRIVSGHVIIKPNVDRLIGNDVHFTDGTVEKNVHNIVLATGYRISFPFLDPSVVTCDDNQTNLYLHMFPTNIHSPPSLALIGCVQPGGALGPVAEMQCRLALKVFLGEVTLPSKDAMNRDIQRKGEIMAQRYVSSQRHTVQVDYIPYMDELAQFVGCKPKWGSLFLRDPRLALRCVLGPCTAYQYRLQGPGVWPQAREAILTQMERVKYPLGTGTLGNPDNDFDHGDSWHSTYQRFWSRLLSLLVVASLAVLLICQCCI